MAEQERKTRQADAPEEQLRADRTGLTDKGKKLKTSLDDILEDIDEALNENAEEFVKAESRR